jgi:hypothetical protein
MAAPIWRQHATIKGPRKVRPRSLGAKSECSRSGVERRRTSPDPSQGKGDHSTCVRCRPRNGNIRQHCKRGELSEPRRICEAECGSFGRIAEFLSARRMNCLTVRGSEYMPESSMNPRANYSRPNVERRPFRLCRYRRHPFRRSAFPNHRANQIPVHVMANRLESVRFGPPGPPVASAP